MTVVVDIDVIRRIVAEEVRAATAAALGGAREVDVGVLTRREVAAFLRIHSRDLRRLVLEGTFPPPFKVGRRLRWRRATVERWISKAEVDASRRSRLHGATADHGARD